MSEQIGKEIDALKLEIEGLKARLKGFNDRLDSAEGSILALHDIVCPRKQAPQPQQEQRSATAKDKSDVLFGLDSKIIEQLTVTEHNGEIRVRPTGGKWLGKQIWNVVNKFLGQDGFRWTREPKNSSWRKRS